MSRIVQKPRKSDAEIAAFIGGAPDASNTAPAPAPAPAAVSAPSLRDAPPVSSRKKPISLTIDPSILDELDRCAHNLGISRAGAFSLEVSRFIAQEKKA